MDFHGGSTLKDRNHVPICTTRHVQNVKLSNFKVRSGDIEVHQVGLKYDEFDIAWEGDLTPYLYDMLTSSAKKHSRRFESVE